MNARFSLRGFHSSSNRQSKRGGRDGSRLRGLVLATLLAPFSTLPTTATVGLDVTHCVASGGGSIVITTNGSSLSVAVPLLGVTSSPSANASFGLIPCLKAAVPRTLPDCDENGIVGRADYACFHLCFSGPGQPFPSLDACPAMDGNSDDRVDLADFALFAVAYAGD